MLRKKALLGASHYRLRGEGATREIEIGEEGVRGKRVAADGREEVSGHC